MADPNLELGFSSLTGGRSAVERDLDACGGDSAEFDGLAGEPDPREVDLGGVDLGTDAGAFESNTLEVESQGNEPPGQIVDLQYQITLLGDRLDPLARESTGRPGREQHPRDEDDQQERSDRCQYGNDRASEMTVSQPPRSPHFNFRWSTWK